MNERVLRVEGGRIAEDVNLAVDAAGTGLGGDLDSAKAERIVLGGERVLVDLDLADGGFGRELAAGEAVDIDLRRVRAIAASKGEELLLEGSVVVRKRSELRAGEGERVLVGVTCSAECVVVAADFDDDLRSGDEEPGLDDRRRTGSKLELFDKRVESGRR